MLSEPPNPASAGFGILNKEQGTIEVNSE